MDEPIKFAFLDGTVTVPFSVPLQVGRNLTGTVRPPTGREVGEYIRRLGKAKDGESETVRAAFYATHVKTWNVDCEPTAENIAKMPHIFFQALEAVVSDSAGCDLVLGKSAASSPS